MTITHHDESLLRHPAFGYLWLARVFTTLAYQMIVVGVGWQMYELTNSAFDLGLVGLVQFAPALLLVLVVGHVSDRYDRRHIVRICQMAEAMAALFLAIGSFQGWLGRELIFVSVFVIGAARAFEAPTLQALLPALIPATLLGRAVAGAAAATQAAIIVGPALGGFMYVGGPIAVYTASGLLFGLAVIFTGLISYEYTPAKREPVSVKTLLAGLVFIRNRPVILGAISLDLFAVLLGGATALLPIFARDILHTGPWGLGLLRSAPAIGALAMSLHLTRHPLKQGVGRIMFIAVAVFGLATIVFGLSRNFSLSLLALVVLGASDMISVVIRSSLVQLDTPDHMRGRVTAVNSVFIGTSNQLGEFESGLTAAWFGVVPAVVLGGIGTLVIAALWIRLFPQLWRRQSLRSSQDEV